MDVNEIKDQVNNWLDTRLKNPYFGAVIAVWLITHRVVVFSLFNFEEGLTLDERIWFVRTQLELFNFNLWFWSGNGFWATVVHAFIVGFPVMILADVGNALAKTVYKFVHRFHNILMKLVEPSKWKEVTEFVKLEKKVADLEDDLKDRKTEGKKFQKDYLDTFDELTKAEKDLDEKDQELAKAKNALGDARSSLEQIEAEKKKFRIVYATYGTNDRKVEVTKTVSDLLTSKDKFKVTNENLRIDPMRYSPKKLAIEYSVDVRRVSLEATEEQEVSLESGALRVSDTPESLNLKAWMNNLTMLESVMSKGWTCATIQNGQTVVDVFTIEPPGRYLVHGKHQFDLLVSDYRDNNRIVLNKIELDGRTLHSTEKLEVKNENLIEGTDDAGNRVRYQRNAPSLGK